MSKALVEMTLYTTDSWDKGLRTAFNLPGNPSESTAARELLAKLGVFAVRVSDQGPLILVQPAKMGNLTPELFTLGVWESRVPQAFWKFQVTLVQEEDGTLNVARLPDKPAFAESRAKKMDAYGDPCMWHLWNKEVHLRYIDRLIVRI